ncbi:unnamed protein product, partial [Prorocentrum cordatum]
ERGWARSQHLVHREMLRPRSAGGHLRLPERGGARGAAASAARRACRCGGRAASDRPPGGPGRGAVGQCRVDRRKGGFARRARLRGDSRDLFGYAQEGRCQDHGPRALLSGARVAVGGPAARVACRWPGLPPRE